MTTEQDSRLTLVNRFNHTSGVTVVTPTDRPKSVRNRCVIEVFDGVFCVVALIFRFSCGCRGFCHKTESDLFLFILSWKPLKRTVETRVCQNVMTLSYENNSLSSLYVVNARISIMPSLSYLKVACTFGPSFKKKLWSGTPYFLYKYITIRLIRGKLVKFYFIIC